MQKLAKEYFDIAQAKKSVLREEDDSCTDSDGSLSSDGNSEADIKESFLWNQ